MNRKLPFLLLLSAGSLIVGLLIAEGLAQVYAYQIAKQGKLFRPHAELGWTLLPDLDVLRANSDGETWLVTTGPEGVRGPAHFRPDATRRVLVTGDSFAFGQGVELDERFDRLLAELQPDTTLVNVGVMGYGTDQQLLAAHGFSASLRSGDTLLLITYGNDFIDLIEKRASGRAKPWYSLRGKQLKLHPPKIGLREQLRDRSYLLGRIFALFEPRRSYQLTDLQRGIRIYQALIVEEASRLAAKGVDLVIAHHGLNIYDGEEPAQAVRVGMTAVCTLRGVRCIDLDLRAKLERKSDRFLRDGHWSAVGHRAVANALAARLDSR